MMDNIYIYEVEYNGARGIVIADNEEQAKEKVTEAYRGGGYGEDFNFSELKVWSPLNNEVGEYIRRYPDVLEVTE